MKTKESTNINLTIDYETEAKKRLFSKGYADIKFSLDSGELDKYEQEINSLCSEKGLIIRSIDYLKDENAVTLKLYESDMNLVENIKIIKEDKYPEAKFKFNEFCNKTDIVIYGRSLFLKKDLLGNKKIEQVHVVDFDTGIGQIACVLVYPMK